MSLLLAASTAQAHDSVLPHGHDPVGYIILAVWLLGAAGLYMALQRRQGFSTP
jgi:hypothetical protein